MVIIRGPTFSLCNNRGDQRLAAPAIFVICSNGFNQLFACTKSIRVQIALQFMRFDPYDHQNGEIESLTRALDTSEYDTDAYLISYEEID